MPCEIDTENLGVGSEVLCQAEGGWIHDIIDEVHYDGPVRLIRLKHTEYTAMDHQIYKYTDERDAEIRRALIVKSEDPLSADKESRAKAEAKAEDLAALMIDILRESPTPGGLCPSLHMARELVARGIHL